MRRGNLIDQFIRLPRPNDGLAMTLNIFLKFVYI